MKPRMFRVLAALFALSLLAASCGDDDPVESSTADDMAEDDMAESGTIVDVAVANGSFTILVAAVQAADLVDTLSGDGPFTVFAPTNAAFAAAGVDLTDVAAVTAVLQYHVIATGAVYAGDLMATQSVSTLNGQAVSITKDANGVMINADASVVMADVQSSNGVVHVIDKVLMPPAETPMPTAAPTELSGVASVTVSAAAIAAVIVVM